MLWSLRFLVRVRGGGATSVESGVSSGGAVGRGCLGSGVLEGGDASSVSLSELPPPMYPGCFAFSLGSVGAVTPVLGLASLLVAPGVGVVSTVGVLADGLFELSPPMCPGPFVSSFGSVEAVPQVLGVASLLATLEVWVVSNLGMFEGGEVSSVSLSELPLALWPWRGWVRLSSHRYGWCRRLHMIVLPVPSPVGLWGSSAVFLWRGDNLLPLASSRLGWSRQEGRQWRPGQVWVGRCSLRI